MRLEVAAADPHRRRTWRKIRHVELFSGGAFRLRRARHLLSRPRGARTAWRPRWRASRRTPRTRSTQGYNILILSDRSGVAGAAADSGAARDGRGARASGEARDCAHRRALVVETGTAREVHHFALLAGYGAEAIHPYLALETLATLARSIPRSTRKESRKRYIKAICKGLTKVMSKMGISTYQSYCGAQIFEAVGLQKAFVDKYFTGTASNVEGIGLFEVAEEAGADARAGVRRRPAAARHARRRRRVCSIAAAAKRTCGRRNRSPSCSTRRARTVTRRTRITRTWSTSRAGS